MFEIDYKGLYESLVVLLMVRSIMMIVKREKKENLCYEEKKREDRRERRRKKEIYVNKLRVVLNLNLVWRKMIFCFFFLFLFMIFVYFNRLGIPSCSASFSSTMEKSLMFPMYRQPDCIVFVLFALVLLVLLFVIRYPGSLLICIFVCHL